MKSDEKRELILNTAKEMMHRGLIQTISVSQIAKAANISKGSIYYYFNSKEDIISAVFQEAYSDVINHCKELVNAKEMNALTKLNAMFDCCVQAADEFNRQTELNSNFIEKQSAAYFHTQFVQTIIDSLLPVLSKIISQGVKEGAMECTNPIITAQLILTILGMMVDNHIFQADSNKRNEILEVFANMQEKGLGMKPGSLAFLKM